MKNIVALASALACLSMTPSAARQATFSAAVNTVALYVTVVGQGGRFETGLSAADFEVREDDVPRAVTQFESKALPIRIVALLDDSASMRDSGMTTHAAVKALIQRLEPDDRAAIGVFSRTVDLPNELTGNREALLDRLNVSSPLMAGTAIWDAVDAGISLLSDKAGRRVVLLLTDGDDNCSRADGETVAWRATREDVMVYAVGIRGAENRLDPGLKRIAIDTGGRFFEPRRHDDLSTAFQRVVNELRNQYLLGFSPAALDGRAHRVDVIVKRRGLQARTRRTYLAMPPAGAPGGRR